MRPAGIGLLAAVLAACLAAGCTSGSRPSHRDKVDEIHASFGDDAETSMWVGWRGSASVVRYGTSTAYGASARPEKNPVTPVDIAGPFEHVMLTGLRPGTVYHYRIDDGPDHQFKTAPTGDFTWVDIGDTASTYDSYDAATRTGCDPSWMTAVWKQIASELPDFVTHGGDISYANECGVGAVHQFYLDIAPIATRRAWEQAWGNHEYEAATPAAPPGTPADSMANYKGRTFIANGQTSPVDTPSRTSAPGCPAPADPSRNGCQGQDWGYFTVGHVLIIQYPEPWARSQARWGPEADALMRAAQANPDIWFIVTTGHRPAYTASTSQLDQQLRTVLNGLADKYSPAARPGGKYVLNIAHHAHGGEVFAPQHGVVQITNGGGGTAESAFDGAVAGSVYHTGHLEHLLITVTGHTMTVRMICGPAGSPAADKQTCRRGSTLHSLTLTSGN